LGWIPLTDKETHGASTWGGHFAFPRELYVLPDSVDGALGVRLPSEIADAVRGEQLAPSVAEPFMGETGAWSSGAMRFEGPDYGKSSLGRRFERIDVGWRMRLAPDAEFAGVALDAPVGVSGVEFVLDAIQRRLLIRNDSRRGDGTVFAELPLPALGDEPALRLLVEGDMAELFMDDRYALAARLPLPMAGMGFSLVASGGPAEFLDVAVHRLKGLEETVAAHT
jgi:hypothetical protein